jgi:hypothetical protein
MTRRSQLRSRALGVALVVLSLVAVGQSWRTSSAQSDYVKCQAHYNEINNARTRILTEVSDRERASSRRVVDAQAAVFRHPAALIPREDRTPQQQREIDVLARAWGAATIQQQQDRVDADAARAENPVPPPPSELCG